MAAAEACINAAGNAFCSTDGCCSISENTESSFSLLKFSQEESVCRGHVLTNCLNSQWCNKALVPPYRHRKVSELFNNCALPTKEIEKQ